MARRSHVGCSQLEMVVSFNTHFPTAKSGHGCGFLSIDGMMPCHSVPFLHAQLHGCIP
jgi:hypothetical protein